MPLYSYRFLPLHIANILCCRCTPNFYPYHALVLPVVPKRHPTFKFTSLIDNASLNLYGFGYRMPIQVLCYDSRWWRFGIARTCSAVLRWMKFAQLVPTESTDLFAGIHNISKKTISKSKHYTRVLDNLWGEKQCQIVDLSHSAKKFEMLRVSNSH